MFVEPIKLDCIDLDKFSEVLTQHDIPSLDGDVDSCARDVGTVLYECTRTNSVRARAPSYDTSVSRWERLLDSNDEAQV